MKEDQPIKAQLTAEGFNDLFEEFMKVDATYIQAYLRAESWHLEKFGRLRYKSYESFRASRNSFLFKK